MHWYSTKKFAAIPALAMLVLAIATITSSWVRADDDGGEESKIQSGFQIAPVPPTCFRNSLRAGSRSILLPISAGAVISGLLVRPPTRVHTSFPGISRRTRPVARRAGEHFQ